MDNLSETTIKILSIFQEISKIPRKSKNEERIAKWLLKFAKENNFESEQDAIGNILIKVPATSGYEDHPTVILQGHMDMVCEKTPDSNHDFSKDPIKFVYDNEWLKADKTTLGADNGIAIAIALAYVLEKDTEHPKLELLFTVDEETGLTGAQNLTQNFLKGTILLNLDSEDEGIFTIGCAGGVNTEIELPIITTETMSETSHHTIVISGLSGGHSGVDIHQNRANAIKILTATLLGLNKITEISISDIKGGSAHNAIPRDAYAVVCIKDSDSDKIKSQLEIIQNDLAEKYKGTDPNLKIELKKSEILIPDACLNNELSLNILNLLNEIPHGVFAMSKEVQGLVETSNNLATVDISNQILKIVTSQRSSNDSEIDKLTKKIHEIAQKYGASASDNSRYPSWQPNTSSKILEKCKKIYKDLFKKEPHIEAVHAGLECAHIGKIYPKMDMISFGPTIQNPHSPDEKLHIPSIDKIWKFLKELLTNI